MAVLVALTWLLARRNVAEPGRRKTLWVKQAIVFILGAVAFTVYSATIPNSPWETVWDDSGTAAVIAAVLLAPILPVLAKLCGVDDQAGGGAPAVANPLAGG